MILVRLVESSSRKYYRMYYVDPVSDRRIYKSSGVEPPNLKAAEKKAAKWEKELELKGIGRNSDPSWKTCRERFEDEYCPNVKKVTEGRYLGTLNSYEKIIGEPERISRVTASVLSKYVSLLRGRGYADAGIAAKLRDLKVFLRWLSKIGLLREVPHFPSVKKPAGGKRRKAKGRAITEHEFNALKKAITGIVDEDEVCLWHNLLDGLWLSGLRLGEAVGLRWDPDDISISVHYGGKYPMLNIPDGAQKSGVSQFAPITPDFAGFLDGLPKRGDLVFPIPCTEENVTVYASKKISRAGKDAGIIVNRTTGKHASAHDLRRSFGTRWATKLKPQALRELMRHANISTTMEYYATDLAEQVADEVWSLEKKGGSDD